MCTYYCSLVRDYSYDQLNDKSVQDRLERKCELSLLAQPDDELNAKHAFTYAFLLYKLYSHVLSEHTYEVRN